MADNVIKTTALSILFTLLTIQARGQAQGPPPPNDPVAPFGFVEILIGAGALYGVKRTLPKKGGGIPEN